MIEIILLAVVALFALAFVIRMAVGVWKFIYDISPTVIMMLGLAAFLLYMYVVIYPEVKAEERSYENHIGTTEY